MQMKLHSVQYMRDCKEASNGRKAVPAGLDADACFTLGLTSIGQETVYRLKIQYKAIGKHIIARVIRGSWTYAEVCPEEILLNDWTTETSQTIEAMCLCPPWHFNAKAKHETRRTALFLGASLSDAWMSFLCEDISVTWKPGFAFTKAPKSMVVNVSKKRKPAKALIPSTYVNEAKKKKMTKEAGNKKADAAKKKATPKCGDTPNKAAARSGHSGASDANTLHLVFVSDGDDVSLEDVVKDFQTKPMLALANKDLVMAVSMADTSIEKSDGTEEERAAIIAANKNLGVVLPVPQLAACMEQYKLKQDAVDPLARIMPVVRVSSTILPSLTLTHSALLAMLQAQSINRDIQAAKRCFAWLDNLKASSRSFTRGLGDEFSPAAYVRAVTRDVYMRLAIENGRADAWLFYELEAEADGGISGPRAYGGHTMRIRELAQTFQASLMRSDVVDASLVELRLRTRQSRVYIHLTTEVAALLRVGTRRVSEAEAEKAAEEVANEAGDWDMLGMVMNLNNNHSVSAVADVPKRSITVYDSMSGVESEELTVAVQRVQILCSKLESNRSIPRAGLPTPEEWSVPRMDEPRQQDG